MALAVFMRGDRYDGEAVAVLASYFVGRSTRWRWASSKPVGAPFRGRSIDDDDGAALIFAAAMKPHAIA